MGSAMQVTPDVTEGATILRVVGTNEALLENYRTLLEYTEENIRVAGKHIEVCITGSRMRIEHYGSVDMKITGIIEKIEFV